MTRPASSKPTADELAVLRRYTGGWKLADFLTAPARAAEQSRASMASAAGGAVTYTTHGDGIHATIEARPMVLPWRRVLAVIAAQARNAGQSAVARVIDAHAADRAHNARRPLWRKHIESAPWTQTTGHPIYDTDTAWQAALDDWYREAARLRCDQLAANAAFWDASHEPADLLDLLDQLISPVEGAHP